MLRGYPVRGSKKIELEQAALHLRHAIAGDLPDDAPLPGVRLFERIDGHYVTVGRRQIGLTYAIESTLPSGVEALTLYSAPRGSTEARIIVALSEKTYEGLERGIPHHRFTFAHELCHATEHAYKVVELAAMPHRQAAMLRGAPTHKIYEDSEWQADVFGAALLMPLPGLHLLKQRFGYLSPDIIEREFRVSSQAALKRFTTYSEQYDNGLGDSPEGVM